MSTSLGETSLRLNSGPIRRQSNGTMNSGRDHGPAQEASFNAILTLSVIHGRESEYNSEMAIESKCPELAQIMDVQIASESLRICIAERSLLFVAPETS